MAAGSRHPFRRRQQESAPVLCLREAVFPGSKAAANGYASTLFDEFVIGMSGVPSRIPEGMLVLSGDVLLLFNPLQIDFNYHGAAAISMKEHVQTGKRARCFPQ